MPRNVRNFWIEATIDGRGSKLEGGPRAKDGGFDLKIFQRDKGKVTRVLRITGSLDHVIDSPGLYLSIFGPGESTTYYRTQR